MKKTIVVLSILASGAVFGQQSNFKTDLYTCSGNKSKLEFNETAQTLDVALHMPNHDVKSMTYRKVSVGKEDLNNDNIVDKVYYVLGTNGENEVQKIGVTLDPNDEELGYWLMYYNEQGKWRGVDIYMIQ